MKVTVREGAGNPPNATDAFRLTLSLTLSLSRRLRLSVRLQLLSIDWDIDLDLLDKFANAFGGLLLFL